MFTIDSIDTLVTAAVFTTPTPATVSVPDRADDLGARVLRALGSGDSYTWVPVSDVASATWAPPTASNVEAARLQFFEHVSEDALAADPELWNLLGQLGVALAFRTDRPAARDVAREKSYVRDLFIAALLSSPDHEGSS